MTVFFLVVIVYRFSSHSFHSGWWNSFDVLPHFFNTHTHKSRSRSKSTHPHTYTHIYKRLICTTNKWPKFFFCFVLYSSSSIIVFVCVCNLYIRISLFLNNNNNKPKTQHFFSFQKIQISFFCSLIYHFFLYYQWKKK